MVGMDNHSTRGALEVAENSPLSLDIQALGPLACRLVVGTICRPASAEGNRS
jgi:hypothetical protein